MRTIRLLSRPRRAWLTSFCMLVGLIIMLLAGAMFLYQHSLSLLELGIALAISSVVSGILWPQAWTLPYRAWNKLARHYGDFARFCLLGLCYMIISAVGMGNPLPSFWRSASSGSGWSPRPTFPSSTYGSTHHAEGGDAWRQGWIRSFASWAINSHQPWVLTLLPFLIALSFLEIDEGSAPPSKTYTLF